MLLCLHFLHDTAPESDLGLSLRYSNSKTQYKSRHDFMCCQTDLFRELKSAFLENKVI